MCTMGSTENTYSNTLEQLHQTLAQTKHRDTKVLRAMETAQWYLDEYRIHKQPETLEFVELCLDLVEEFATSDSSRNAVAESRLYRALCSLFKRNVSDAIECAEKFKDSVEGYSEFVQALWHYVYGIVIQQRGLLQESLHHLHIATEMFQLQENQQYIEFSRFSYSLVLREQGNYTAAYQQASLSLQCALARNSPLVGYRYESVGILHHLMDDGPKGFEFLEKARQQFEQRTQYDGVATVYQCYGTYHSTVDDNEQALHYYLQSLQIAEQHKLVQRRIFLSIGDTYTSLGQYTLAMEFYNKGIALAQASANTLDEHYCKRRVAELCVEQANYDEAEELLKQCEYFFSNEFESAPELFRIFEIRAKIDEARGEFKSALAHYKEFHAWRATVYEHEKMQTIKSVQLQLESEIAARERDTFRIKTLELERALEHKRGEIAALALAMSQKNEVIEKLNNKLSELAQQDTVDYTVRCTSMMHEIELLRNTGEDQWLHLQKQFESLDASYQQRLLERYPTLSQVEIKICLLMRLHLSTKDIASILWLSPRTVETHRFSIRKKMNLEKDTNLSRTLQEV